MLTKDRAQAISALTRDQAKEALSLVVTIELGIDDEDNARVDMCLDFLYDTLAHAVAKGFSWSDVCRAVELSRRLLVTLAGTDLVEATRIYQRAALASGLDNRSLVIYTEFFFATFMRHHKLFQYILTSPRDEKRLTCQTAIEPPLPPGPLKEARHPSIHEYERKFKEIQSQMEEVEDLPLPVSVQDVTLNEPLPCPQTEAIQAIIKQVIEQVGHPLLEEANAAIIRTYNDLEAKLQATTLARPKQLGPPPRYPLKRTRQTPRGPGRVYLGQ